jgi:HEAT repeat protein
MTDVREEIARLIPQLDHPDAELQRGVMDQIVIMGSDAIDPLAANLNFAEPAACEAIVRILGEIGDTSAMVPLMRFVFDNKESIEKSDARGLAMRAIMHLAQPSHAPKLFDFLMDVRHDQDPFVRGWALEAMGKFGDARAEPILRDALSDEHDFVRERATSALDALEDSGGREQGLKRELSDTEILQKLRNAKDGEKTFYLNALAERDDAFELAARLVREGNKGELTGLQLILNMDDSRGREVARRHFRATDNAAHRAICLRILARFLQSDASPEEIAIIQAGFQDSDSFVRMAASAAAGVSGDEDLVKRAIGALKGRDIHAALSAAEALGRGLTPKMKRFVPQLRDALEQAHYLRLRTREEEPALLEAHLLRAINNLLPEVVVGRTDLQNDALRSLEKAGPFWPVIVSALRLLRDATAEEPARADEDRWTNSQTRYLVDLLDNEDDRVRSRVIDLLKHAGAPGETSIATAVERLIHDASFDVVEDGIPLLELAGGERSRTILKDLSSSPDERIANAAAAALRDRRNSQSVIDVSFFPSDS